MKKEDLEKQRIKSLKKIIQNAYNNVPYYNALFKENNLKISDIKTVKDINKIPIVSKQEIRENIQEMISSQYPKESLIEYETSGSTGTPLPVYVNRDEDDYRKAKHLRSNIVVGQRPRDKYVCITSPSHYGRVPGILKKLRIFDREFVSVFDDLETQLTKVQNYNPDILAGYSSSLFLLAKEAQKQDNHNILPKFLLGGAELSPEPSRRFAEKIFQAPFIDQYAIIEVEKIAWQCKERNEYHIDADSVILQFVDKDGEEVAPGERGEMVCTSLFNNAMPFIRYKIGDIGIPSNDECSCDISFPTMKIIEGREDSMITMPGGIIFSPRNFAITVNHFEHIFRVEQWRLIQRKLDHFEIYLVMDDESIKPSVIETELIAHMHKTLNMGEDQVTFNVNVVENMPKDKTGKLRAVYSQLEDINE